MRVVMARAREPARPPHGLGPPHRPGPPHGLGEGGVRDLVAGDRLGRLVRPGATPR